MAQYLVEPRVVAGVAENCSTPRGYAGSMVVFVHVCFFLVVVDHHSGGMGTWVVVGYLVGSWALLGVGGRISCTEMRHHRVVCC